MSERKQYRVYMQLWPLRPSSMDGDGWKQVRGAAHVPSWILPIPGQLMCIPHRAHGSNGPKWSRIVLKDH